MNDIPNLVILIPYSQGLMVYRHLPDGEVRYVLGAGTPQDALEVVCELPHPRLAAILDDHPYRLLAQLLVRETEICLIPDGWLNHIPIYKPCDRAQFSVQLVEAFLKEPIRLFGAKDTGVPR
jgi:hypothetical protein